MTQRQDPLEEYVLTNGISVGWGYPEEKRVYVVYDGCADVKDITFQDALLKFTGRFLKVRVNLSAVCPERQIVVGVILQEKTGSGFMTRGLKACETRIPEDLCTPLTQEFCFVIPEGSMCNIKDLRICVVAHYSSYEVSNDHIIA